MTIESAEKSLTKEAEFKDFLELSEEAIKFIEDLKTQFEDFAQSIREAFEEIAELAEETEPATQKFFTVFIIVCVVINLKPEKRKSNHYFSMARGPPEILRA